jgi:integration host factor subunit beta
MTKRELIEKLAQKVKGLSLKDAELVVETVFSSMSDALAGGDRIEIRGFGSFQLRVRKPRQGRNPKTGDQVSVPEKKVPFFKVGKELRGRVNEKDNDKDQPKTEENKG